jgi:hypothetical protein
MHNIIQYYINDILVAISDWRRQTRGTRPNKLWVHSDNAWPHTAKCQGITLVSIEWNRHLIPLFARFGTFGLFLFGYVKGKMMRCRAETPYELLVRIRLILAEIPRETLNTVFPE